MQEYNGGTISRRFMGSIQTAPIDIFDNIDSFPHNLAISCVEGILRPHDKVYCNTAFDKSIRDCPYPYHSIIVNTFSICTV